MKKIIQCIAPMLLALALPVLSAANQIYTDNTIAGSKNVITQDRQVPAFHALKVSGGIDVELLQGNTLKLQVEADDNLVALIRTEVKDGVLTIWHDETIHDAKAMKIHLTFQQMDAISASGGCDIESKQKLSFATLKLDLSGGCDIVLDCKADKLVCKQSGGCDAGLSGEAQNAVFEVSGGCDVKASDLYLKDCTVDASGGSDVSVRASGELNMKASGASDITYYGKPAKITQNANGASDITGK